MKRKNLIITALVFIFLTPTLTAADFAMPPGKWWKVPQVVRRLELTSQQQNRLDDVFLEAAAELIDLRGEVEKRGLLLRAQIDRPELNQEAVRGAARAVSEARGDLFERELMMMIEMRTILTAQQWDQLRRALDEREGAARERRQPPPRDDRPNRE